MNNLKYLLKEKLRMLDSLVTLTTDNWSSNSQNNYLDVTVHYVDENFKLKKNVLAFKYMSESKTTDYLYRTLDEIMDEWGIQNKTVAIVSDSCANIMNAIKIFDKIQSVPCAGHRLNLCVNDILNESKIKVKTINNIEQYSIKKFNNDGELKTIGISSEEKRRIEKLNDVKGQFAKMISKCRRLVGSFRHSEAMQIKLKEKQNFLKYQNKTKLVQDINTRWNSTFDMLDSVLKNKDAIKLLALEPENKAIKDSVPTDVEFDMLNELCDLLFPLKNLTVMLSGQKYCTISFLFPTIYKLINYDLNEINLSYIQCIALRDELLERLNGRFAYVFNNDLFIACTFMDFRMKNFEFVNNLEERKELLQKAKTKVIEFYTKLQHLNFSQSPNGLSTEPVHLSSTPVSSISTSSQNTNSLPRSSDSSQDSFRELSDITNKSTPKTTNQTSRRKISRQAFQINFLDKNVRFIKGTNDNFSSLNDEIQNYVEMAISIPAEDKNIVEELGPFYFFETHRKRFTILSKISRSLLSICATSVPSESLFSQAGLIQTDIRNRLNPKNLENLTILKENLV